MMMTYEHGILWANMGGKIIDREMSDVGVELKPRVSPTRTISSRRKDPTQINVTDILTSKNLFSHQT